MKLSGKQLKVFNRVHKKYPVSLEFINCNREKIFKFIKYSLYLHFVYRCKLIFKKFRAIIRYNVSKKIKYRSLNIQNSKRVRNRKFHDKIKKLQALPWSQRVVFYLKKQRLLEKIKEKGIAEVYDSNNDLKGQSSIFDLDENSLSNSASIADLESTSTFSKQIQSDSQNGVVLEDNNSISSSEIISQNEIVEKSNKENENVKNIEKNQLFCEKIEAFQKTLESTGESKKNIVEDIELNDENADTISNSDSEQPASELEENTLSPEQIERQLKTQLELLKCGKRSLTLLADKKTPEEFKKSDAIQNDKTKSTFKLSTLLNNKRLSGENSEINNEVEESSEDTGSNDIVISKNSKLDNVLSDNLNENIENAINNKITISSGPIECSAVDSFEISEKDALEAGPSSKEPLLFKSVNEEFDENSKVSQAKDIYTKNIEIETGDSVNNTTSSRIELYDKLSKSNDLQRKSTSIVDSLISKLGNNLENKSTTDEKEEKEKPFEKTISVKTVEQLNNLLSTNLLEVSSSPLKINDDNSSSSDDFFGFNSNEMIPPEIPGMLPTPAVPTFSSISAFISKDDKPDRLREIEKTFRYTNLPRRCEEGLVRVGRPPPKFEMAALPDEMSKPRTLAEKRMIFSKQRSFKYFMIENENTIYHELKRRSRDGRINTNFVRSVQRSRVPASRDLWKATCWLLTENEKFYFQTAEVDGLQCKILFGLGNFSVKNLSPQYSSPVMNRDLSHIKEEFCPLNCVDKKVWQSIRVRFKSPRKRMQISQLKKIKMLKEENRPGPLRFKKKLFNDLDAGLNELEIYKMPKIELEVYPKLNQPLDDYIKSYLKLILPSESITKEWAEFAVSTLVEKANQDSNENISYEEDKGKMIEAKNSFKFTIPYLNDQTHILVRKVLRRSENFDNKETLMFRQSLENSHDEIAIECANILSDMIDSVAIGLSENSFINDDPDINYDKNNYGSGIQKFDSENKLNNSEGVDEQNPEHIKMSELSSKRKRKGGNPKSKLMKELKRLNATIINASDAKIVAKPKMCEKEYCRFGCVCASLGNNNIPKNHCKKVNCMLENCNCPVTLIEAENSIITSEDAFVLRQKATARLARMEREFTSTVVLTGNETLLINENQTKRKRRNNARLTNYYTKGLEDEEPKILTSCRSRNVTPTSANSVSPSSFLTHDEELKDAKSPVKEAKLPNDINSICYIDDEIMKSLKHCTVDLYDLKNFDDKVKWCMVHCLYKCFCNGKDTEGKPYVLKKLEKEEIGEVYTRKAQYSFDKSEDESLTSEPPKKLIKTDQIKLDKNKTIETNSKQSNATELKKISEKNTKQRTETLENITPEQKHKENRIISAYINNDFYGCHRVQPVPRVYRIRNKRPEIKNHWRRFVENDQTKFMLSEKVRLSENYVRKVIVKRPPGNLQNSNFEINHNNNINKKNNNNSFNSQKQIEVSTANKDPEIIKSYNKPQTLNMSHRLNHDSLIKPELRAKLKSPQLTQNSDSQAEQQPLITCNLSSDSSSPLFKISSVFSLNNQQNNILQKDKPENSNILQNVTENEMIQELGEEPKYPSLSKDNNEQFTLAAEQVQKEVMKRLNFSVTKTMHNITKIQSEDIVNIPNPQPEMMVSVRWKHFLQYYVEDKLHIWEVKIDKATYFVGTMKYAMPYVVNAIGVINIKAVRRENSPLFAQMLNAKFTSGQTDTLSILMSGHRDYWRILGMTKSLNKGTNVGVIRPTTESHPNLTPKINKLFNILAQQYIENLKKISMPPQQVTPTSIASLQNANKKVRLDSSNQCQSQFNQLQKPVMKANQLTTPTAMVVINNNSNLGNVKNQNQQNNDFSLLNSNSPVNYNNDLDKLKSLKMNIKIRKLTRDEVMNEHFQVPITNDVNDHRWLVLDLEDDFSHIIFMNSMESLAHNKIKLALQRSQTERKMVRFPKVDGHSVDCYVMKFDKRRIYLGPFHESIDPVIILYQNVDGKMIQREDYEMLRGIKRLRHTTGFWLCRKNGNIMFDSDPWISELSTINLQQQNQQNIDQLLNQHPIIVTQYQSHKGIGINEAQNSLIQLVPENISLIQSQCDNVSVSGFINKNSDFNVSSLPASVPTNVVTESIQQAIKHTNKIGMKPYVISSTPNLKPKPISKMASTANTTNISEKSIIDTALNEELSAKKIMLSKSQSDSPLAPTNTLSSIQTKPEELIIDTQKMLNMKELAKTNQTFSANNISGMSPSNISQQSVSLLKPPAYSPHMRTQPSLPKSVVPLNTSSLSQKLSCPPVSTVQKIQISTTINSTTSPVTTLALTTPANCNRVITPTTLIRPFHISCLKSKEYLDKVDSKIIGKYNQVIISKTLESSTPKTSTGDNKDDSVILQERAVKGPVTAEVEEQNGQLILKLPENLQNKILSQQFTVSKSENGTLILEPSGNTNSMSKSILSHDNNVLNKQIFQNTAQNIIQCKSNTNCTTITTARPVVSTTSTISAAVSTSLAISIPSTKLVTSISNQQVPRKNNIKVINSSANASQFERKISKFVSLKAKEPQALAEKPTIKTIITKIPKSNDTIISLRNIVSNTQNCNEKIINKNTPFTKMDLAKPTTLTLNEPVTTPKIGIIDRKCSNTKTTVLSNQKPENQFNQTKLTVKSNTETGTSTMLNTLNATVASKSGINLKLVSNNPIEKSINNETNTKVISGIPKNFGIYYPGAENSHISPLTQQSKSVTVSEENNKRSTEELVSISDNINVLEKEKNNSLQTVTEAGVTSVNAGEKLNSVKKLSSSLSKDLILLKKNDTAEQKLSNKITTTSSTDKSMSINSAREKVSNLSERTSTATISNDPILKGYISGYFVAQVKNYPKFGGYRKDNEYLIKTNSKSVLNLPSIAIVGKHLNGFVKKQCPAYKGDVKWEFVAFKNQSISTVNTAKFKKNIQLSKNSENPTEREQFIVKDTVKSNSFKYADLKISELKDVIVIDDDEDDKKTENMEKETSIKK